MKKTLPFVIIALTLWSLLQPVQAQGPGLLRVHFRDDSPQQFPFTLWLPGLAVSPADGEVPTAMPTTTPTPTETETQQPGPTATHTPTVTPTEVASGPCECTANLYNCSDFSTQNQAQACFDFCVGQGAGDIHQLDSNNDGKACESLPGNFRVVR